jgi:hypothetical protein
MQPASRISVVSRRCALRAALFAVAITLAGSAAAAPDSDDEAFYQRAASCVAAMQVDQYSLVGKVRGGATELRPELLLLTKLGFAYVGEAYLKGLRDPRGADMVKAATADQKDWPEARHKALVAQCRAEAQKLYDNAGIWKWAVDNKAKKRVDRFVAAPASAGSAASR